MLLVFGVFAVSVVCMWFVCVGGEGGGELCVYVCVCVYIPYLYNMYHNYYIKISYFTKND